MKYIPYIPMLFASNLFCLRNPCYVFSHGIVGNGAKAYDFLDDGIIFKPVITFDYHDKTDYFWRCNGTQCALAQEYDVVQLAAVCNENAQKPKILIGQSRGASTILYYMAQHQDKSVKALVLESPFDSIETVIKHLVTGYYMSKVPGSATIIKRLLPFFFWKYSNNGIPPIDMVDQIPQNLSILIICSHEDWLVPWNSSAKLYKALRNSGHKHTYLALLEHGKHGYILDGSSRTHYQQIVHAFYQKYNLPHDKTYAKEGGPLLALKCQPIV